MTGPEDRPGFMRAAGPEPSHWWGRRTPSFMAAGAFTRMVLWDPESQPYWEVEGPATPLTSFLVGVAPEGFRTVTEFRDPPRGALLRLVAFRRDGGPVGIRYRATDLRPNRVVSGNPLTRFTIEGFQTAEVCEDFEPDSR